MTGQGRPWYAPAAWMWSKRPRKATTWTGLAGWVFVLAGIASFLAFRGVTGAVAVSFCVVGFGVSTYADHRMRNKTYGRGSDTVRPMSRRDAREYVQASKDGGGRVPHPGGDGSGKTWVSAHDREGTDGVTGHFRDTGGERASAREREQREQRAGDAKTARKARARAGGSSAPVIDAEWWEEA